MRQKLTKSSCMFCLACWGTSMVDARRKAARVMCCTLSMPKQGEWNGLVQREGRGADGGERKEERQYRKLERRSAGCCGGLVASGLKAEGREQTDERVNVHAIFTRDMQLW